MGGCLGRRGHRNNHARVVQQMGEDKKLASERLALLNALFAAEYTHEWGTEPSDIWRELVLDALQRKDD